MSAIGLSFVAARDGALEVWQPLVGSLSLVVTALMVFAAAGAATPLLLSLANRPLRSVGGLMRVPLANLTSRPRRTASLAASVAAAVGLACVLGALVISVRGTVTDTFGREADGRVWVSMLAGVNNAGTTARVGPHIIARLAAVAGVASIDQERCVRVADKEGLLEICSVVGLRGRPIPLIAGEADAAALTRGDVIAATGVARTHHLHPGSTWRVATPTGFRSVRIAGIWADPNFNGYALSMSSRRLDDLFGPGPPTTVLLRPAHGVSAPELVQRIRAARIDPDLHALTPSEMTAKLSAELGQQVAPFWFVQRTLLFVALVATLSMLLLIGVQRRRELGILGAVGFGPRSLARITISEAVAVGLGGSILGVVASVGLFEALRNVAVSSVGATPPFRFDVRTAVVSTGLAVVVVAIAGAFPAWRASRLDIVDAIRDE